MAYDQAGEHRKFQLQELDELRLEAYENARNYKQKERLPYRLESVAIQLKIEAHSRWDGPFVITNIFPHGAVQLKNEHTNNTFQVNGHQIKPFHEGPTPTINDIEIISLAFPFSLDGATKDWLYLQPALLNTWGDMKRMFLEMFFPASRTATIKKEIYGIRQQSGETLHEYFYDGDNNQETTNYVPPVHIIKLYFYEGLLMMDRSMIDATSGGALMDKTPAVVRHLIFNLAGPSQSQMVNEIGAASNLRMENQLSELTYLVRQLAIGQHQPNLAAKVCGICTSIEHPTNVCPMLQETESDQPESVGAICAYQYGKQPYQNRPLAWKTTNLVRTESRALCSSEIRTYTEHTTFPIAESVISSTTFPTTAVENAPSRQFPISKGPDEATCS
ncbi:hypothetical protein CR513_35223, partial [Mucuna pruriens]